MVLKRLPAIAFALLIPAMSAGQTAPRGRNIEFNSLMMESTFRITGPTQQAGRITTGTGFVMGKAAANDPAFSHYVLITAAHVLNGIVGDTATLVVRVKAASGQTVRTPFSISIRNNGRNLWTQHPSKDIAVIYVPLPNNVIKQFIDISFLASAEDFTRYQVHTGDEVFTVGYPSGIEANSLGYAILRSGRIASYPMPPDAPDFWVDFSVFGGNSGGAIYMDETNRLYNDRVHLGERVIRILGIVVQQAINQAGQALAVAVVVPSMAIRETLDLLPPKNRE